MAADFQLILGALIAQPDEAFSRLPAVAALTKRMRVQTAISS
jgi:hypothetical protein